MRRRGDGRMTEKIDYYDRDEWSCSDMKPIIDSGIDYAVALKKKMITQSFGNAVNLGQLAHMFVLGGDPKIFAVSPYNDFRTKEARNWKAEQEDAGKYVIDAKQYEAISKIVDNVEAHPLSQQYLSKGGKHEVELYATVNGVKMRGKADWLEVEESPSLVVTDLKTTAQFDEWKYKAMRRHYDLQAAIYLLLAAKAQHVPAGFCNFYFCVVETVEPYRVQYHHCSQEFLEHGEQKLAKCLEEIKKFGDKEPNFLIEEVNELGDFSL